MLAWLPLAAACGAAGDFGPGDPAMMNVAAVSCGPSDYEDAIDQTEFVRVIQQVIELYQPSAAHDHAATMIVRPAFSNMQSVFASRLEGVRQWVMEPRGRSINPRLTRDVARLITCHEVGHFFGGFPFGLAPAVASIQDTATVLSSEGTADYFATKDCLWRVWAGHPDNAAFATLVSQELGSDTGRQRCDTAWSDPDRRAICYRSMAVAHRAIAWLDNAGFDAKIDQPSTEVVIETKPGHFDAQCRFDTIVAGAVCDAPSNLAVIPGLVPSELTGLYGGHSIAAEAAATPYACQGASPGARPLCWFKPNMPDNADCGNVPDNGLCDGNDVLTCNPHVGAVRNTCPEGSTCAMVDEPGIGLVAECE
jgi:hypothetical protein